MAWLTDFADYLAGRAPYDEPMTRPTAPTVALAERFTMGR
jgi:hypothetical protein